MFSSQDKQDEYLETNVFKGYKNGFFMDIGAHDGVTFNNTLYFEKYNNWKGINVEPINKVFQKLKENRPECINLKCAVCETDGKAEFICNKGYTEMLSGLSKNYDPRHNERLQKELVSHGGKSKKIEVRTKRIETICDENNVKHINYLSIDVEGAEFDVIKSINFDKVFIDVIGFECNYEDKATPIINYLESKNFVKIYKTFDIFMINRNSQFYKP